MNRWLIAGLLPALLAGCAHAPLFSPGLAPVRRFADLPLPHCQAAMDEPEYWISKLANPDRVTLTPAQIQELNRMSRRAGMVADIFSDRIWDFLPENPDRPESENGGAVLVTPTAAPLVTRGHLDGYTLYTYLKGETERLKAAPRWDAWGSPVPPEAFAPWDANLNLGGIRDSNPVHYGLTRVRTEVRYYPTYVALASRRSELEFDILQVSSLRALQPVAILHASRDGRWFFVVSPFCQGWVWGDDVAADLTPEEISAYLNPPRRLVVTGRAAEAAWNPGDTGTAFVLTMGTALPLLGEDDHYYQVGLPGRAPGGGGAPVPAYIARDQPVQEGFLACTPRNLYRQAFKLLRTPYAWGGKNANWDCSQLIMDVYATVGLELPRNSSSQAMVGNRRLRLTRNQTSAQRQAVLDRLDGPVLLQFPGHIMLYLGRDRGRSYVIHDIWSYRQPGPDDADQPVVIGRVVVSDLSLGEDSRRGSLLDRITLINRLLP